jgi:hypothetical protein
MEMVGQRLRCGHSGRLVCYDLPQGSIIVNLMNGGERVTEIATYARAGRWDIHESSLPESRISLVQN